MSRALELVEVVTAWLVDENNELDVRERSGRAQSLIEVYLTSDDFGRVIGRQGRTANAIRTLASLAGELEGRRVQVEFHEIEGVPRA